MNERLINLLEPALACRNADSWPGKTQTLTQGTGNAASSEARDQDKYMKENTDSRDKHWRESGCRRQHWGELCESLAPQAPMAQPTVLLLGCQLPLQRVLVLCINCAQAL